jgi:putative membrane protein
MRTRQWIQSLILLFLGLYFLDNMLSGRIYFYINERFGWLSWIATGIFLILGIVGVEELLRERRTEQVAHEHHDHEHEHDHEHALANAHEGHNHGQAPSWPVLAVLALPLLLGLTVPAKPLGASAIGTSGVSTSFSAIQGAGSTTQLSIASTDRNVLDWVRAFNSTSNVEEFNGQQADLIGFVYRDVRLADNSGMFMIAPFTVSCCVADASAIGVFAQADDAAKLPQDGWVHVKGSFKVQDLEGERTPILVAQSVEPTTQPEHPYLYL